MAGVSFIKILCHDSRLNINFKDRPLIWSPLQVDLGQKTAKHQTCIQWSSTAMRKQRAHETETESAPDFSGWDLVIRQRSRLNFCNLTLTRCSDKYHHSEVSVFPSNQACHLQCARKEATIQQLRLRLPMSQGISSMVALCCLGLQWHSLLSMFHLLSCHAHGFCPE